MKVSAIIAAYNEAGNIEEVICGLKKVGHLIDEIIVVDDGSSDETSSVASNSGARVIKLESNKGKGEAIKSGINAATGDVFLFIDGDGQDDPGEIPSLLDGILKGYDLVNGSRFLGTFEEGAIGKINYFGNFMITQIINFLFGTKITDSQAGFRCVKAEYVKRWNLKAESYEIETEMILKAIKNRLRIMEVPVTRKKRGSGRTKFRRIKHGFRILFMILKEKYFIRCPTE